MKKINNSSFVMLLAAMLMVSTFWACTFGTEEIPQAPANPGELVVNLRTSSGNKLHTRAALTTIVATNEEVVNNMVVGIFKNDGTQSKIEKYTTTDLGANASADGLQQNVTTSYTSATQAVSKIELDDKVLVVINVPDDRLDDFTANTLTYTTFKQLSLSTAEAITHTADGTEIADDALPMWGEGKVAANGATFKADVTVIRMVAKVTLASLTANFTESLHPNAKFKLTEVFLLNVPDATDLQYTWNAADDEYTYTFGKIADAGDEVTTYFTGQEKITDANGDEVDLATTPTDNFPAAAAAVQKHLAPYVGSGALTTVEPITTGSTAITGYTFYTLPNNSATYNTKLIIKGKYTDDESKDPVATKGHDAYYAINLYPNKTADATNKDILPNTNYSVSAVIKGDGADDAYSAMPKMETIESTITTLAFDEYQNTVTFNGGITNEALAPAKVGDLVFDDGTWGTLDEFPAKTPVAIVFSTAVSAVDYAAGYTHGYAIALKDVNNSQTMAWSTQSTYVVTGSDVTPALDISDATKLANYVASATYMNGRSETAAITGAADYSSSVYPAAYAAVTTYESEVAHPTGTSGWYLPSIGQQYEWVKMLGEKTTAPDQWRAQYKDCYWSGAATDVAGKINANAAKYLKTADGTTVDHSDMWTDFLGSGGYYWSSTESAYGAGYAFHLNFSPDGLLYLAGGTTKSNTNPRVRPVLAF